MTDLDYKRKKSLGISNIVYDREKVGNRVVYRTERDDVSLPKKNAEAITLHRWKKKNKENYKFNGSKLNPKIWRFLPIVFGNEPIKYLDLNTPTINKKIREARESNSDLHIKLPAANNLYALFQALGSKRLSALVARHNSKDRMYHYGTPDLFLYSIYQPTGSFHHLRFVEVKKPKEPLSQDQKDEIEFLQSLNLHALFITLIER